MLLLLLFVSGALCEPHQSLEEGDSPCLHKPCQHGVCLETPDTGLGYTCFCQGHLQIPELI